MRNKFHNYIENVLSFYATFFTKDIIVFKYHSIHNDCNATKRNAKTIKSISERNNISLNYVRDEVEGMLYSAYSVILGGDCKLSDKGFTDIDILLNENDEQFF